MNTDQKLKVLWQKGQHHEIISIATRNAPTSFSEDALFIIAEAFEYSGRVKETSQAYLAALKKRGRRSIDAAFQLISKSLVTPTSAIYMEFQTVVLEAIGTADISSTERLLRYVINVDLQFYESILWRYFDHPNPKLSFAVRLMTFGGTEHLESYRGRILERTPEGAHRTLLDGAAAYSLGKHNDARHLLDTVDPKLLNDDEFAEYLVIKHSVLFALGEYDRVGLEFITPRVEPSIRRRLSILKANAQFAAGAQSEAHAIRWHTQTEACGVHLAISNLNENAFLKTPTYSYSITLVADEGLGDTIYFIGKYRDFIRKQTFIKNLAVPERHIAVMRHIVTDLGISLMLVDKAKVLSCVTGTRVYQTKLAFLSNIPHLMSQHSPKWFLECGVESQRSDVTGPPRRVPRIAVSCKTFRLRNKREREIDIESILTVFNKLDCEILLLDEENTTHLTNQEAASPSIKWLKEKASTRPELAYDAIKSADLYVGICNTYIYMAGLLGVPSFCLLPLTPRDIWIDRGEFKSPYASVSIAKKDSVSGWTDALVSLRAWIKKATPKGVA